MRYRYDPYTDRFIEIPPDPKPTYLTTVVNIITEPKRGRWIKKENATSYWYECSECGGKPLFDMAIRFHSPYCPYCGAKMKGADDE